MCKYVAFGGLRSSKKSPPWVMDCFFCMSRHHSVQESNGSLQKAGPFHRVKPRGSGESEVR
eukprot:CAMPEP_0175720276 /NCGR_PEP_ID=MMETSP0097-20121207/45115_1 /TAXON_ID=311494 /ORGANISM="Alexandrium monilatum, Strain CCMP3105" /LENGTH=60 /DNA_ID=CAMNT_0017027923 /DNA_START=396 /DNA_END=574 /DNA_ORIENTATION=+